MAINHGYCDCCQRCYATDKLYVHTKYNINTQIDLCKKCLEIMDEEDKIKVAEYSLVREKILFLRDMPPTLEERLEEVDRQLKEERHYSKNLEHLLVENDICF